MIIFDHKILQIWLNTLSVGANVAGTPRKFWVLLAFASRNVYFSVYLHN